MEDKSDKRALAVEISIHCYLQQKGYLEVETPIMTNHLILSQPLLIL